MHFLIEINNSPVEVQEGETLLKVFRRHGIRVPTLCHMEKFPPTGACRLCVVEVAGKQELITSCSYPVEENMRVFTNTQRVQRARKLIVEMLLSAHPDDCLYCTRNGNCELQGLAEEMNVKERRFYSDKKAFFPDHSSPSVFRDPSKCVLCSRCVRVCDETQLVSAIDFISRGNKTVVNSAFKKGLNIASCIHCGQCIMVCPTSALSENSHIEQVQAALDDPKRKVIFLVSPVVSATLTELTGLKADNGAGHLVSACLKKMGAHKVFDLGVTCDMNIRMEAQLLAKNMEKGAKHPLINSCCPGFVKFAEDFMPEYLSWLAPIRSPQQIFGRLLKTLFTKQQMVHPDTLYTVAVMPCVGNKFEGARLEMTHRGVSEIDAIITTREFLQMARSFGLNYSRVEPVAFDEPYAFGSPASFKMGYSGGKAESVAAALSEILNPTQQGAFRLQPAKSVGGIKEAKLVIGQNAYGFAWVSGMANASAYLGHLKEGERPDIHYVEVMACQGGCIGGGGQPIHFGADKVKTLKKVCQEMEKYCIPAGPGQNPKLWPEVAGLIEIAKPEDWISYFQTGFGQART